MADGAEQLPDVKEAFKGIQLRRKYRYVMYEMAEDQRTFRVCKVGERKSTKSDFIRALPDTQIRCCLYDLEYKTADGRRPSKLLFIYWTPLNANQTDRIQYAQALRQFRDQFPGTTHADVKEEEDVENLLSEECLD